MGLYEQALLGCAAGFVVGFLWFISFGMSLIILQSCKWKIYGEKRSCWRSGWVSSVLLFMLTWIKIIGCVLLSVGQDGFYKEATQTLHFIMNRSDFTVQSLRNISEHLSLAKSINVEQMLLPLKDQTEIDKLNGELNNSAAMLDEQTVKNSERVHKAQKAVRCWLIIMATLMLLLSMLGLLFYILRHRQAGYIFILIGWLFVAITFVVYGVFTIVDNVIADTCVSMKEWLDNPRAESALSSIIPCVDEQTTNQTLYQSKEIIHELVNVVNTAIIMTANSETVPKQKNYHFYNQSGPPMPILCSPFDSQLNIHQCHSEEVTLANASQVWKNHTCMVSVDGLCISPGRVTPSIYQELVTAVNVSYALYHYSPFVLNLQNCNFVRDTFRIIVSSHCPPIKHQLQLVIVGLVLIGVGLLLSLVLWLLYVNLLQRKEVLVSG